MKVTQLHASNKQEKSERIDIGHSVATHDQ